MSDEEEVYAYSDDGGSDAEYAYGSDEVRWCVVGGEEVGKEEESDGGWVGVTAASPADPTHHTHNRTRTSRTTRLSTPTTRGRSSCRCVLCALCHACVDGGHRAGVCVCLRHACACFGCGSTMLHATLSPHGTQQGEPQPALQKMERVVMLAKERGGEELKW